MIESKYFIYGIDSKYSNGIMSFSVYDDMNIVSESSLVTVPLIAVKNGEYYYDLFTNELIRSSEIITPISSEAVKVVCLNFIDNNYSKCLSVYKNNIMRARKNGRNR